MGCLKLIISFMLVATMEYSMRNNAEWKSDKWVKYTFEIAMSILCAGWIAHEGW